MFSRVSGVSLLKVEVMAISKAHDSPEWLVHYKRRLQDSSEYEEQTLSAAHVILGVGALGSTKIPLLSKERGLQISSQLGRYFTTTGDVLGFSYNGDEECNALGFPLADLGRDKNKVEYTFCNLPDLVRHDE